MTERTNAEGHEDRTVPSKALGEPRSEGETQQLAEIGSPAASTELAPVPPMGDARPSLLDEPLDAPVEEDEPTLVYRRTTSPPPFDMEGPPVSMNEPCGLLAFLVAPTSSLP